MASYNELVRLYEIQHAALAALIPPPRLNLADWIEQNLVLPADVSAQPGRVRLYPFQRGIAEAISDPEIERVTLVKCVRVGLTTLLTATIANYAANEPSPIMLLLPTDSDCRDYCVSDLEPIFAATPSLRGLLSGDNEESGRNTLTSRRFPGNGSLKIIAAKAQRNLRRHNIKILLCDEIDGMEVGPEGDSIALAERRTLSFSGRKLVLGSTPTVEETSAVLRSYAVSDQRIFEVPCPECGTFTEILWRHIEWQPDRPETAAFRCPHCAELILEKFKPQMIGEGVWKITKPEITRHAGFRINALVSPHQNASWARLATEFLQVKDDPSRLRVFINTYLAEGFREAVEDIDDAALQARVEPFGLPDRIPPELLVITAGCDVQDDRLEISIVGWSRDEIFILAHTVVWGSVHDDSTWQELDDLLKSTWKHPNGGTLRIDATIIDSSDNTSIVYGFTRPRFGRHIFAGKGASGTRPVVEASKGRAGVPRLFILGVDQVKAEIMTRLARGRTIRFSDTLPPRYFEELASERRVIRYRAGSPYRSWERIGNRAAECLDSTCYAFCARRLTGVSLDRREAEVATAAGLLPAMPATIRSKWLEGGRNP